MFGGGGKGSDVQTPQVAQTAAEYPGETGRTEPQSEAELIAIKEAEDAERRRQLNKEGQQDTILTKDNFVEDTATKRKTLLGA
jgi:hypothetical protein